MFEKVSCAARVPPAGTHPSPHSPNFKPISLSRLLSFIPGIQTHIHHPLAHIHPFVAHLPIYSSISWPTHSQVYPSIHPFNHLYIPLSSHPTYECGGHLSNPCIHLSSCPTVHPPDSLIQPNIHEQIIPHKVAILVSKHRVMSFPGLYDSPYSGENTEAPGSHTYWKLFSVR